jgi:hypothetical protein
MRALARSFVTTMSLGGLVAVAAGCPADPIIGEGQFGRGFSLATGDDIMLPRLAFIDEGCPGTDAAGGCSAGECSDLLIDSLAPLTALRRPDNGDRLIIGRECIEARSAQGLAVDNPDAADLDAAVTRFRFRDVPALRAAAAGTDGWTWTAGDQNGVVEPAAVLGGNALGAFAVSISYPPGGERRIALYTEFPGTERTLADQGRTFLPLQFPGRLLGQRIGDACDIDGERCNIGGFDIQGRPNIALQASRMVLDACVAIPPCTVQYDTDPFNPFEPGTCSTAVGPDSDESCVPANDAESGGRPASLVVATSVSSMVLFDDSAVRMFGDLDALPACDAVTSLDRACLVDREGTLHMSGWPSAGDPEAGEVPLYRLRVRSVALLPGLTRVRGEEPCTRADTRFRGLLGQCIEYTEAAADAGSLENTTPPYAGRDGNSDSSLAVLGEVHYGPDRTLPDTTGWLETLILPAEHPLPLALRRDVAPEALQPDGLVGATLFEDRITVLDYTDPNPGVRVSCLEPSTGDCLAAPPCAKDAQPACCFGLPVPLLAEFIILARDETCCSALSRLELREIQELGFCQGIEPA